MGKIWSIVMLATFSLFPFTLREALGQSLRKMENLGRGVVAVRSESGIFVSWRLLGLDPAKIAFNVYRSANNGKAVKLNKNALTEGTNFLDSTADPNATNSYHVRPVVDGKETAASTAFTLTARHAIEPVIRIRLQPQPNGTFTKFVWVGDLDGDGEYDYVVDRLAPLNPKDDNIGLGNQKLEAYRRDGTRLWVIDLGPSSRNTYNIEPGATTISMGHYDGVTVYDLNGDGRAEVILKVADGVKFGDGSTFSNPDKNRQFLAIVDGVTGANLATKSFPTQFLADGPLGTRLGVGYLNGTTPSVVAYLKNRDANDDFNLMICSWTWKGGSISQSWCWDRGTANLPDGHQSRIVDLDGDGKDEFCEIGFCLNGDGTLRYGLGKAGVVHGDRFQIGKFDPDRPGLQGYAVQQDNPSGLLEYYYDASNGAILWRHSGPVQDIGRGLAGDISPDGVPGYEVWSFQGVYTAKNNRKVADEPERPYPNLRIWWDGDTLSENLNETKIDKWEPVSHTTGRLLSAHKFGATPAGNNPTFYGDILGDWREEVIYSNAENSELLIFTTDVPTNKRIYTLPHNPAYRNGMTLKGYMQAHYLDYYLGDRMATPPVPRISY